MSYYFLSSPPQCTGVILVYKQTHWQETLLHFNVNIPSFYTGVMNDYFMRSARYPLNSCMISADSLIVITSSGIALQNNFHLHTSDRGYVYDFFQFTFPCSDFRITPPFVD